MGKLATTRPWAAKVPTVREYWESVRKEDESPDNMQIEDVQAAVDRGWAMLSVRLHAEPVALDWRASRLYRDYCLHARRRPGVEVTEMANLRGRRVFVGSLSGPTWTVPLAGRRLLLSLATSAMEVEAAYGGLFDWVGSHFRVVIPPEDIEMFAASVRDIVEEHVEELRVEKFRPRRRRGRSAVLTPLPNPCEDAARR